MLKDLDLKKKPEYISEARKLKDVLLETESLYRGFINRDLYQFLPIQIILTWINFYNLTTINWIIQPLKFSFVLVFSIFVASFVGYYICLIKSYLKEAKEKRDYADWVSSKLAEVNES